MLDGGVLLLEMSGLLTTKALAEFAMKAIRAHGHEARGFVLDYRRGVILATDYEMERLVETMAPGTPITRPGAFVATPANVEVLRQHAIRIARKKIWRRVAMDVDGAVAWVRSMTAS